MLVRLASGSPRRLELLRQIGLEVDVIPAPLMRLVEITLKKW